MPEIRIGTCGFRLPQGEYFRTFDVIELQQTFYQPPQLKTAERWRRAAPAGFEFTLKAFQAITHGGRSPTFRRSKLSAQQRAQCGSFRDTPVVRQAWQTTLEIASALQASMVVFQCPGSFRLADENLNNMRWFFGWAQRGGIPFGWEPRGPGWPDDLIKELCSELDLVHVVDPFVRKWLHGAPCYYRLHGIDGYDYQYSNAQLRDLKDACTASRTYCMFNNIPMLDDALRFRRLTGS